MNYFMLLILNVCFLFNPAHDVPIAFFNLDIKENSIDINIKIDRDDTMQIIKSTYEGNFSKKNLEDYLKSHLIVKMDEKPLEIVFVNFTSNPEHIIIEGTIPSFSRKKSELIIQNMFFIKDISNQSNIVNIKDKENQRTFRLTKRRTFKRFTVE